MRSLAELQKLSITAVKHSSLIGIALYSWNPSTAHRIASEHDWYSRKAASCRFLAIILRDYGFGEFQNFVWRMNPGGYQKICWCECHQTGYRYQYFLSGADQDCKCCVATQCFEAAHTFGYDCNRCDADREGKEETPWIGVVEVPAPAALPLSRVEIVAQRLFAVIRRNYGVNVVASDQFIAWAEGDSISLTTAVSEGCNDDELAMIMSHELAHNLLGHPERAYRRGRNTLAGVSNGMSQGSILAATFCGLLVHAVNRKADRDSELEADRYAVQIMKEAGFDPVRGAKIFERLQSKGGLFSTHPTKEHRMRNIA